jgi:hypothetical protein
MAMSGLMNNSLPSVREVTWWSPNAPSIADRIDVHTMLGTVGVRSSTYCVASRNCRTSGMSPVSDNAPRYPPARVSSATASSTSTWLTLWKWSIPNPRQTWIFRSTPSSPWTAAMLDTSSTGVPSPDSSPRIRLSVPPSARITVSGRSSSANARYARATAAGPYRSTHQTGTCLPRARNHAARCRSGKYAPIPFASAATSTTSGPSRRPASGGMFENVRFAKCTVFPAASSAK